MTISPRLQEKKNVVLLCFAAAAAVAIAGMLHLMLAPGILRFNVNQGVLFTVGGIAQVFWIIPMVRRLGPVWYSIGAAGNAAFFAIWLITRFPGNPITGRGDMRINSVEMVTEATQIALIGLALAVTAIALRQKDDGRRKPLAAGQAVPPSPSGRRKGKGKKGLMILAGIVIALILTSWFLLPSLMPRRGPGNGSGFRGPAGGEEGASRAGETTAPPPSGGAQQQQRLVPPP
jgi:hypothetical protein